VQARPGPVLVLSRILHRASVRRESETAWSPRDSGGPRPWCAHARQAGLPVDYCWRGGSWMCVANLPRLLHRTQRASSNLWLQRCGLLLLHQTRAGPPTHQHIAGRINLPAPAPSRTDRLSSNWTGRLPAAHRLPCGPCTARLSRSALLAAACLLSSCRILCSIADDNDVLHLHLPPRRVSRPLRPFVRLWIRVSDFSFLWCWRLRFNLHLEPWVAKVEGGARLHPTTTLYDPRPHPHRLRAARGGLFSSYRPRDACSRLNAVPFILPRTRAAADA
jgi:hypothetical protein